jgi:epoxyqueuosine reductase
LGKYGRNNISYIEGMGSYFRLRAYYSELPCGQDSWQEPEMLEECVKCTSCVQACPTGAIDSDRFLLHAERCIPFFNERQVGFPEWFDPSWHNSLVGCMICQNVCPVDKPFRDYVEDKAEFTEEETKLILNGLAFEAHSLETQQKLAAIEWTEDLDMLARNLRLVMDARSGAAGSGPSTGLSVNSS